MKRNGMLIRSGIVLMILCMAVIPCGRVFAQSPMEVRIGPEDYVDVKVKISGVVVVEANTMVINGDFGSADGWVTNRWQVSGGSASVTSGSPSPIEQDVGAQSGKTYRVIFTVNSISGAVQPSIGGTIGTQRTSTGTYSEDITATGSDNLKIYVYIDSSATIDDVQVYEIPDPQSMTSKLMTIGDGLIVMDGNGNMTTLSSHNTGPVLLNPNDPAPFAIHHRNVFTGKEQWIYLSRLAQLVEELTGEQLIWEKENKPADVEAWKEREQQRLLREAKEKKGVNQGVNPVEVELDAEPSEPRLPGWVEDRIPE